MNKPDCKYGADCYQKNPAHKEKYAHPAAKTSNAGEPAEEPEKSPVRAAEDPEMADDGSPSTSADRPSPVKRVAQTRRLLDDLKRYKRPPTPEKDDDNAEERDRNHQYHGMTRQRYALPEVPIDVGLMSDIYDPQIEYSKRVEYKELCGDPKQFIKHKFLVDMPVCFDALWEFCQQEAKGNPPEEVFLKLGLQLVGPFDVLANKFVGADIHEPGDYLRHWRFFYDPPEFQTALVKKGTGVHYGYWRDQPDDVTGFVAKNDVNQGCEMKLVGENIFDAVMNFLDEEATVTPFNRAQIAAMKKKLEDFAKTKEIALKGGDKLKERSKKVVCKTFHKAGLVVPFDRKQQLGYRQLQETDANLKVLLGTFDELDRDADPEAFRTAMGKLQPVITAAFIAVDECDFGTALELALDLFCYGATNLHQTMKPLFITGYSMLKRPQSIAIIKSHLENRRKGIELDLLAK